MEIQKSKIDDILSWATNSYRNLILLSQKIETRLDAELAKDPLAGDLQKLQTLFDQKHAIDDLSDDIETLILRNFANRDELAERWRSAQERLARIEQADTASDS